VWPYVTIIPLLLHCIITFLGFLELTIFSSEENEQEAQLDFQISPSCCVVYIVLVLVGGGAGEKMCVDPIDDFHFSAVVVVSSPVA